MASRKAVFQSWEKHINSGVNKDECLLLDGRMTGELYQIFAVQGNNEAQIKEYKEKHLFDDSEVAEIDCTVKSSTFMAMGIASMMTGMLCNFLTNRKLGMDLREIPFTQRMFMPIVDYKIEEVEVQLQQTV